jgi:hypothetical protein
MGIDLRQFAIVLAIVVVLPFILLLLSRKLLHVIGFPHKILEWTLALGGTGFVIGLGRPDQPGFVTEMAGLGLLFGFLVGLGLVKLEKRGRKASRA